ncbi:hypothetical protein A3759_08120 [Thalassolituus sp. HI0120]|nr:hypothetical protein A3759_08120 [Thalassolituus sp. HI0120]
MSDTLTYYSVRSINEIDASIWQRLLHQSCGTQPLDEPGLLYPFLDYRFLKALEDNECIDANIDNPLEQSHSGWLIHYLVGENAAGEIQQILPCFIKQHSYGEYVFDWAWADAYQRHGFDYYPKLLLAAPFTPATGPRVLGTSTPDWSSVSAELYRQCVELDLSGLHINFISQGSHQQLSQVINVLGRQACQFHWINQGADGERYQSFDHYLEHFTSRKRKSVRKERKKVSQQHIRIERKTADQISDDDIKVFYHCYQMTYARRRSRGYLNLDFFRQLLATMPEQLLLVSAAYEDAPDKTIACALYLFDNDTLYGRYWGALADIDALHFEACYYQGIEFCIERGLKRFDPGTQGEHKISRGFQPTLTYSAHQLLHPEFNQAVARFLNEEEQHILAYRDDAEALLPFRTQDTD